MIGLLSQGGAAAVGGAIVWIFLSFSRHVVVIAGLVRIGLAERARRRRADLTG